MTPLSIVVCDDEPLAVRRLEAMLGSMNDVRVVGSALHGREAIGLVEVHRPDLLFLDVEMPEIDGFEVVEQLAKRRSASDTAPLIAFVTAYRQFAAQAYDTAAIDFLSKPFRISRLEVTLSRARQALESRDATRRLAELQNALQDLRDQHDPQGPDHVWVSRRGEVVRVSLSSIERVVAEGPYVRLHVGTSSYLLRQPIGSLERRLDSSKFVRVHRSHIVRLDTVASIRRVTHGASQLVLRIGGTVPLGRKYARETRRVLLTTAAPGKAVLQLLKNVPR